MVQPGRNGHVRRLQFRLFRLRTWRPRSLADDCCSNAHNVRKEVAHRRPPVPLRRPLWQAPGARSTARARPMSLDL